MKVRRDPGSLKRVPCLVVGIEREPLEVPDPADEVVVCENPSGPEPFLDGEELPVNRLGFHGPFCRRIVFPPPSGFGVLGPRANLGFRMEMGGGGKGCGQAEKAGHCGHDGLCMGGQWENGGAVPPRRSCLNPARLRPMLPAACLK